MNWKNRSKEKINIDYIKEQLKDCYDVKTKIIYIEKQEAFCIYINGLVDKDLLQRDFINPILELKLNQLSSKYQIQNLPCVDTTFLYDSDAVLNSIMSGNAVFLCEDLPFSVACNLIKFDKRSIEEPITEKNVRGPHEGFVEVLQTNFTILRRKIKSQNLKFKTITLGKQTRQNVAIAYIEGVANETIVNNLYDHISNINLDGLPAIGYIEQSIISHPHSLFPQFYATERPDKAVAGLLEGRILVLQEGTPVVLIAPVSFISFFQALDDYSTLWIHGSFLRMLRIVALLFAIFLPSLYIAITSYHYYAIPLNLLIPLAESRAKVPFPPIIEVLILEAMVEMVREAAVRLPTYIGTSISVVAGLIIGQAAVQAGIVSDLLIVIVAATAVASYVVPSYDMSFAVRILRFLFMLASSVFGIIGIVVCSALTIAHLITIESLGQPYLQPFSPFKPKDLKDTFLRLPLKALLKRQDMTRTKNINRGKENEGKR